MPNQTTASDPQPLKRYLGTSLVLHIGVCVVIIVALLLEFKKVETQEALFMTDVIEEEERIKEQALESREEAVKELLKDQTLATLEQLLEDHLEPEDEAALLEQTMEDIQERIDALSASEQLEMLLENSFTELSEALSKEAFEQLRKNLTQLKQDMLLEQVRTFIRTKVAPEIQKNIEKELKNDLGHQIKQAAIQHAKRDPEATEQALKEASEKMEQQVRDQITKEVKDVAIPLAAERMIRELKDELKKRDLNDKTFQEFVEKDIRTALEKEMKRRTPEAELALLKTKREFKFEDRTSIDKTRTEIVKTAKKLRELADREETFKGEVPVETPSRDAMKQHDLAKEVREARKEATQALDETRKQTIQHDTLIKAASERVNNPAINKTAVDAARAMERELVNDAKSMMSEVVEDLRASAEQLEKVGEALKQEATTLPALVSPSEKPKDAQEQKKQEKISAELLKKTKLIVEKKVKSIVRKATLAVDFKKMMGSKELLESLAKLDELGSELDQTAENLKEGRELGETLGMGLLGPGQGNGFGRLPSLERHPWATQNGRMEQINLRAYKEFVEDMRDRLDPDSYYKEDAGSSDLVTHADTPDLNLPAVIFHDEVKKIKKDKAKKREVPKPAFKTIEFGAAAMMEKKPKIDGDLSDWGELRHGLELRYTGDRFEKIKAGPTVYVRWSPDGLYFAYTIKDINGIQPSPQNPWDGDALEVMLDMANSRRPDSYLNADSQKITLAPFGCMGHSNWRLSEMGRGLRGLKMAMPYPDREGIKGTSAGRKHGENYTVEGFISRRALAQPYLIPGKYVGLNFCLNQGSRATSYQWSASQKIQTWRHPDTWGDLLLLGSDATLSFAHGDSPDETPKAIAPEEVLYLQIKDADMNINTRKADRISAELVVLKGGSSLFIVLGEVGVNTGVFQASVHTQAYFKDAKKNTLNVRSGSTIQLIYSDARTEYGEKNRRLTAELGIAWPIMQLGNN